MKAWRRILANVLILATLLSSIFTMNIFAAEEQAQSGNDNYSWQGKWIWSNDQKEAGQWVSLRKTFALNTVPDEVQARIAADSKYWLWINGEMVVFEGAVKTGPNRTDMYYDKVDIANYLKKGENTIAVQAVYFGKNGYGFKDSGQPGFLFDADFGDNTRIVSDSSWKAVKDPAYEEIGENEGPNYRIAEPNIKYNAAKEMSGWTSTEYDDSDWANAVEKANVGDAPYNNLAERPIPQLNVEEIVKFTADGQDGTGMWKTEVIEGANDTREPLSLPDEYQVTAEFMVEPYAVSGYGDIQYAGALGLTVAVQDGNNFYMPQISMADLGSQTDKASYKPHILNNGGWTTPLDRVELKEEELPSNGRFGVKHTIEVDVDAGGFDAVLDENHKMARVNASNFTGGSIGLRNDAQEHVRIYSLKVTSKDGEKVYFEDTFQNEADGATSQVECLSGESPVIKTDENGVKYLLSTNNISRFCTVTKGESGLRYTIRNRTNIQGTSYLKVKAPAGKKIDMWTDTWYDVNGNSVRHAYLTKEGEQEYEPLGWMNGYDVYFDIPSSVEVLELGFRPSTYDTTAAGSFTSDDTTINTLYQKAYDTLLVTMRDNYMDCPNRERAQWWGDAVNEMQMAFYAMDSNAGLLYKKTLNQVIGWKNSAGQLPTTAPNGIDAISELPMQALAGVHSFWQYYLYSGDIQPLEDGYESLMDYLKLWDMQENGQVSHRAGTWDWMDWGDNFDNAVIEQCWYYIAAKNVKNIAVLLDKPEGDIKFLDERMESISEQFETNFWDESRNAYYNSTKDGQPDDRANALAVYAGLAQKNHYEGVRNVLTTIEKSSPYMEKYVLEALYMMGYDDDAMARTKSRYSAMIEDEFPTLWEFWVKEDGTANHAWSGGPLSMMYMFNAGITPITAAYDTFQVRPQPAGMKNISAKVPSPAGDISVTYVETENEKTLNVTVPSGSSSADICVPRLDQLASQIVMDGKVIYKDGAPIEQDGVVYKGEDAEFVTFTVKAGEYNFVASRDVPDEEETYQITIDKEGKGSIQVNGEEITEFPYVLEADKGSVVTVNAVPEKGSRLNRITGTYPSDPYTASPVENTYTVDRNINYKAYFEDLPKEKYTVSVTGDNNYSAYLKVNGEEKYLPYKESFYSGDVVEFEAVPINSRNYSFVGWSGALESTEGKVQFTVGEENSELHVSVEEKEDIEKYPISTINADNEMRAGGWGWECLKDGERTSVDNSNGFTTNTYGSRDISGNPHQMVVDLGEVKNVNQISLFPRSNAAASGYRMSCNFPVDFTIEVSIDGTTYQTIAELKDYPNPHYLQQIFNFEDQDVRYVRITTTKLGLAATDENTGNAFRIQLAEIEVTKNNEPNLPVVDKSKLNNTILYAEEQKASEEFEYVIEKVKKSFNEALENAQKVADNPEATQEEVNSAEEALLKEIENLKYVKGDISSLTLLVETAKSYDLIQYFEEGQDEFREALKAAEELLADADNATEEEIKEVSQTLLNAMNNLKRKADKSALNELIERANAVDTDKYTDTSVKAMQEALTAAVEMANNDTLSEDDQSAVNEQAEKLKAALDSLELKENQGNGGNIGGNNNTNQGNSNSSEKKTIATGDHSNIIMYIVLTALAAAAVGVSGTVIIRRKRR